MEKLKKLTPNQIQKYDINQKIIHELASLESRIILFSIVKKPLSSAEISRKHKIPLSTVYKKLQDLEKLALTYVERIEPSEEGGLKTKYYKSRIRGADISISKQEPKLILVKNKI